MGTMKEFDASFSEDFDPEYDFDAPHYFDFSRDETESEAEEAENWFRFAHEYPPSPFIVKLKLMKAAKSTPMKPQKTSSTKKEANKKTSTSSNSDCDVDHKAASTDDKIKGVKHHSHIPQDNMKAKSKSIVKLSKPSGSSFMKPTASHLAKQNKECDTHSGGCGSLQKPLVSAVEKLRSPIRIQNQTTKRQKLEFGYLRKAAQLKHRATFLHKTAKKAEKLEGSSNFRVKPTIPKRPPLVAQDIAQRHRSQNKSNSIQQQKEVIHAVKARPLNKKTNDVPKLPQHKKNLTSSNEVQLTLKHEADTKVLTSSRAPHVTKRCAGKANHYGTDRRIAEVKI